MKKTSFKEDDELRPEYERSDFTKLECGKYADRLAEKTNVVVLDPDVAEAFPNNKAVNDALRGLIEGVQATTTPKKSSTSGVKK
jgi:hypothetical protein